GLASLMAASRDRMMFDRVFLSAPMVGLYRMEESLPRWAMVAETACFLGLGAVPFRRGADRRPDESMYPDNPLTSDMLRYKRMVDTVRADDGLYIGSPSFRWLAAAMRAMLETRQERFPSEIRIPLLILAAAREQIVSTPAIEQLGLRLRTGRHMVIAGSRHEMFMESDAVRGQVLAAFDAFVTEQSQ